MGITNLKKSRIISYEWWRTDNSDIIPQHIGALEESAEARIYEMIPKGYTSGQLVDNIYMMESDTESGVDYTGVWSTKIEDEKEQK